MNSEGKHKECVSDGSFATLKMTAHTNSPSPTNLEPLLLSVLFHKYDDNRSRVNEVRGWMYDVRSAD